MNYSGLLVSSAPHTLQDTIKALELMQGVEVHHVQEESDRCIVVIEAATVNDEMDKFKEISALPHVIDVSLVVHQFEEDAEINPLTDFEKLSQ